MTFVQEELQDRQGLEGMGLECLDSLGAHDIENYLDVLQQDNHVFGSSDSLSYREMKPALSRFQVFHRYALAAGSNI